MSRTSRRAFLAQSGALCSVAPALFAYEKMSASNLGVQLYTVRDVITQDPAKVLGAIEKIGYKEIEAVYGTLDQIWPALKQTSLKPVSVHVDATLFKQGGDALDSAFSKVKERGFKYVVCPYIPVEERGGEEMFARLAETLNRAGQKAQANGMKLCYHNHAFEYKPVSGGKTGLELLMSNTQKGLVSLELDIFWASVAGHNPVEVLEKYSGRVLLVHLKDKSRSFNKTQFNETVPKQTFQEVGNGSINIPVVLRAAAAAGVENYFVEQDQTPGDPIASLKKSYSYLAQLFGS